MITPSAIGSQYLNIANMMSPIDALTMLNTNDIPDVAR